MSFHTEICFGGHLLYFAIDGSPDAVVRLTVLKRSCLVCLFLVAGFRSVCADHVTGAKLHTGRRLTVALESRRALNVQDASVRSILLKLQEQSGICIVVDRRVDPSQRLTFRTDLLPTNELLRQVTAELPNAVLSVNRAFVYIGPAATARRLRTFCEHHRSMILDHRRQFDKEIYRKLSTAKPLTWGDLTSPRDIVVSLVADAGLTAVNPDAVPHDLWYGGRVPGIPFAESATLLLSHFDLTFRIDADSAEFTIIPMLGVVLLERRHQVSRRLRAAAEQQLARKFPGLEVTWERFGVRLRATWEQHEQIEAWLSGGGQGSSER